MHPDVSTTHERGVSMFGWKKQNRRAGAQSPQNHMVPLFYELNEHDLLAVIGGQTPYPSQAIAWVTWRKIHFLRNLNGRSPSNFSLARSTDRASSRYAKEILHPIGSL
jgi:hypothetical protein